MERRRFIGNIVLGSGTIPLMLCHPEAFFRSKPNDPSFKYHHAEQIKASDLGVPDSKRLPFRWQAFAVNPEIDDPQVFLTFKPTKQVFSDLRLRLCNVMDVREHILIHVYLTHTSIQIGTFDIRYPIIIQPFEIIIPNEYHDEVFQKGISLKMVKGSTPVWFLDSNCNSKVSNHILRAHLLGSSGAKASQDSFFRYFYSINSVQQFGWLEGCVLDGLFDLYEKFGDVKVKNVIDQHLSLFFDEHQKLNYEGARSQVFYNEIYGIECPLPIAVIAKLYPEHPVIDLLIDYSTQNKAEDGWFDEGVITTEGCYTLAYPLAMASIARENVKIAETAIQQLLLRHDYLFKNGHIYQRGLRNGQVSFESWARGVAWYMLGMIRTFLALHDHKEFRNLPGLETIKRLYIESVEWALKFQQKNGMWYCYLAKSETDIDTSGSAGIAAAIAIGQKNGVLPFDVKKQLVTTKDTLMTYLTPDGLLTGTAQSNKGGEELQKSGYRVIASYASGLYAQLIAAL